MPLAHEVPYLEYAQIFTASSIWYDSGKGGDIATFDVTIRDMPGRRNFMMLGGIETVVNLLQEWRYEPEFASYLVERKVISPQFGDYLKNFSFKGDLWAMPEGTICFPGEPVIRITAPLVDANLLTAFLVNAITYSTLFLSKGVRVKLAAHDKPFFIGGAIRALSFENVLEVQRLSYLLGSINALPFTEYHFGVTKAVPAVSFYHAIIKSFNSETEAYEALLPYAQATFATSMIDTYDYKVGLANWIKTEKQARIQGYSLGRVSIDSGDLLEQSRYIRKHLDQEGLDDVPIVAYSNLDEFKIAELETQQAPIDIYCAVTEVLTASDRPVLEAVYKLAELVDPTGKVTHTAKLTPGKESLPGRKQVFRQYDTNGKVKQDIIGLDSEDHGQALMVEYIKNGKPLQLLPDLEEIRTYIDKQLAALPDHLRDINQLHPYPVIVSDKLQKILKTLRVDKIS